jgi:hypothetical protein
MQESAMLFNRTLVTASLLLFLLIVSANSSAQPVNGRSRMPAVDMTESVSIIDTSRAYLKYSRHPFVDSLLTDSLFKQVSAPLKLKVPSEIIPRIVDPYDPFAHKAYFRRGQGKFWFFIVTLAVLGLFIYYRLAFPKQFYLRFNALFNNYYFQELISDLSLTFTSGSLLAMGIAILIMAQLAILIVIYSKLVYLNNLLFFILVIFVLAGWKILLYFGQLLYAGVLQTTGHLRNMVQRQISFDFWFAICVFPLLNLVYYNSGKLQGYKISDLLFGTALAWLVLRLIFQFVGLIREKSVTFNSILYFCALEILPHIVIASALLRIR